MNKSKNKTVSLLLCIFFGYLGAHKFYEGKIMMGFVYLFTAGLFGIGWIVDIVIIARKPNPYYVDAPVKETLNEKPADVIKAEITEVQSRTVICEACGAPNTLTEDTGVCEYCGTQIS